MTALFHQKGSDIILGANDGQKYDPAHWLDYWRNVPDHKKVFVEPVPPIFAKLQNNTKSLGNVLALNSAVRGKNNLSELVLHCWDLDMVDSAVKHGAKPLPPEVRQPKEYWSYLCSVDRRAVLQTSNVLDTPEYSRLSSTAQARVRAEVDLYIKEYTVPALTPKEIVRLAGPEDVRYVQIDVEGLDTQIVQSLPFGEDGFWPEVILYENHDDAPARRLLREQGYYVCCCFSKWGNNVLAVRSNQSQATH